MLVQIKELLDIYENDIKPNIKNKKRILQFEKNKMEYIVDIKYKLENNLYDGGTYNIFLIKEPKKRIIMSQSIYDKLINHYVAKTILLPKLDKYLCKENCATRKNKGISYAINLLKNNIEYYKKYNKIYCLKLDIKKYFYTIDHNILKELLKEKLNDDEYSIISKIIDSTNKDYVNDAIKKIGVNKDIKLYEYNKGLPIGNMTSQFLAIFYLYKLHHYIIHNLHLTKIVVYMDDYVILNNSKYYLNMSLKTIENKLNNEYKLQLNTSKTNITLLSNGLNFLGYNFKIINKKTIIKPLNSSKRKIRKNLKKAIYNFNSDKISFAQYFNAIENYKHSYKYSNNDKIKFIVDRVVFK